MRAAAPGNTVDEVRKGRDFAGRPALGHNTGAGAMLAFARGATPESQARSYTDSGPWL